MMHSIHENHFKHDEKNASFYYKGVMHYEHERFELVFEDNSRTLFILDRTHTSKFSSLYQSSDGSRAVIPKFLNNEKGRFQ